MKSQKEVWNNIAKEWYEFKDRPSEGTIQFLEEQKGKILDLGSGAGRHLFSIKDGKMYLADFSKEMIKYAKEKAKEKNIDAEFSVEDFTKLSYPDNFFDGAICTAVLHCIEGEENRKKVVEELYRVLKVNARVKVDVWNKDTERFKNSPKDKSIQWRDKGNRYYYLYNEKEILDLFKSVGFKIVEIAEPRRNIVFVAEKV